MSLFRPTVERTAVRERVTDVIHMRPIGVYENGSLLAMAQDFADGDATFGHIVNRAPLRVRTANDGMRRLLPVPGRDDVYLEMGQPFVQVGGVWTQVSLGTPSRTGHTLTWTRPQTLTTVVHGGHFLDMRIELLSGYVPENSRIAFPVGLNGLTRSGLNILHNGGPVARLRPFAMVDAANSLTPSRPITHAFTTRNGQPFLVLTLPSLTGMARPVIDPTLELQPDATAGKDNMMEDQNPTTNYSTLEYLHLGETNGITALYRSLIQFDLSSIPASATVDAANLVVRLVANGNERAANNRTGRAYRLKRVWVEAESSWNNYSTGNAWQTAGAGGANDAEAADIGSCAFSTTDVSGADKTFALTASAVQEWTSGAFANNGIKLQMDTETNDTQRVGSSDHATAANRPKLTVEYTVPATATVFVPPVGGWCH